MLKVINLFKAEILKYVSEFKRYIFNSVSGLVVFYIIFLAMFFGVKTFTSGQVDGDSLDSLIVGYLLWTFAIMAFQSLAYSIYEEVQRGTMEQFYQTSVGIEFALLSRIVIEFLFSFFFIAVIFLLTMLTTGRWISFNFFQIFGLLCLTLPSLWGLALFFAGLAMIYKKIASVMQIITFGLIAIVSLPAWPINIFTFLPFAGGATTINKVVVHGHSFPFWWYIFLSGLSIAYLAVGVIGFKFCEKRARSKNLLSQY